MSPSASPTTMVSANFFSTCWGSISPWVAPSRQTKKLDGGPDVVILSHGYWQRRFNENAGAVGETMLIDGAPYEIVGVLPADFWYPRRLGMWFPMRVGDGWTAGRGNRNFSMAGRLAAGVSIG